MFDFIDDAVSQCAESVRKLGGTVIRYRKDPPATAEQIARVANRFGGGVPPELIQLGLFSNSFEFLWKIDQPGDPEFGGIYCPFGKLEWDFSRLWPLDPSDYWWAEEIIAGERDGVWHQKTIIGGASNGDFLAYTIDPDLRHVPVYCAKDGAAPTELILGSSLSDFFRDWARIGFLDINEFYEWPRRTGRQAFDVSYFDSFARLLGNA